MSAPSSKGSRNVFSKLSSFSLCFSCQNIIKRGYSTHKRVVGHITNCQLPNRFVLTNSHSNKFSKHLDNNIDAVQNFCTRRTATQYSRTVLGIETSCDDTGAAVVNDKRNILGEGLQSQCRLHVQYVPPASIFFMSSNYRPSPPFYFPGQSQFFCEGVKPILNFVRHSSSLLECNLVNL